MKINRHRCLLLGILFLVLSITICYIGTFFYFIYFKIKLGFVGPATQIFFIIISLTDLVAGKGWFYSWNMSILWLILRPYVLILFYGGVFLLILRFIVKEEED